MHKRIPLEQTKAEKPRGPCQLNRSDTLTHRHAYRLAINALMDYKVSPAT